MAYRVRMGMRTRAVLSGIRFRADDLELLVGRHVQCRALFSSAKIAVAQPALRPFTDPGG